MKIKISYLPQEEKQINEDLAYFLNKYSGVKVHRSDRYPPFLHLYLSTKTPKKSDSSGKTS